jgi:hypothetical protein
VPEVNLFRFEPVLDIAELALISVRNKKKNSLLLPNAIPHKISGLMTTSRIRKFT